ncbi:MAG: glycoside hydrolase family 2 TIM barrel-domain containing protein [Lachnospiraceae bacterium]
MLDLNKGWKFALEGEIHGKFSFSEMLSAHLIDLDESKFDTVDVPHDYSIEQPYNGEIGEGCTGYTLGGLAWYRKSFEMTEEMKDKKVFICFDGIYNRSNIYFNEELMAFHPFGYSPCMIDVTQGLREGKNVIAVHVDHTRYADSRWYTGSGIYRKVEMYILPKTYIPVWGTRITTDMDSREEAIVTIKHAFENECDACDVTVKTLITDPNGAAVCELVNTVSVDTQAVVEQQVTIENPILWGIFQGNQYSAVTTIIKDGEVIQTKETKFGIRYFKFDVNEGFFLNGKNELIKGVCLHHDAGLVGAAVPQDVWRRRLEVLASAGCNAIRTAHNPVSRDFITLCDEMGMLVQEEFYDEWDNPKDKRNNMADSQVDYITRGHDAFFQEYAKSDLQAIVERDYNSPSIIQWSIGNEIEWTYPKIKFATGYFSADANGNYFFSEPPCTTEEIRANMKNLPKEKHEIGDTAMKLATWTKEIDTTRPVIANCILPSASYEAGYTDALDMVGFSYRQVMYERCHRDYPDKPIMGTENVAQWQEWKHVVEKPYISGIFLWTGIDYMGECGKKDVWPVKANRAGIIDVAAFEKPSYHMMRSLWTDAPCIHIVTQTFENSLYNLVDGELVEKPTSTWKRRLWRWHDVNPHFNYTEGDQVVVEMYSNCDSITLFHNDVEISTQQLADHEDRIYKWIIPYTSGKLVAVGKKGDETIESVLASSKAPVSVVLTCDREEIKIGYDYVAHIVADLYDEDGHAVKDQDVEITYHIDEAAKIYGFDSGATGFVGDHKCPTILTNAGRALAIIGGVEPGVLKVTASVDGNISNEIKIVVK